MLIDYNVQKQFTMSIDIVDIGNTTLRCIDVEGNEYYLIAHSVAGRIAFLTFGPIMIDSETIMENFKLEYKTTKFDPKRIIKFIENFVNDSSKKITEVVEVTEFEALETLPNVKKTYRLDYNE